MIKKESTKLGYIADYKKDVDDIISLLQTYPDNAEMKKNFLLVGKKKRVMSI